VGQALAFSPDGDEKKNDGRHTRNFEINSDFVNVVSGEKFRISQILI